MVYTERHGWLSFFFRCESVQKPIQVSIYILYSEAYRYIAADIGSTNAVQQ